MKFTHWDNSDTPKTVGDRNDCTVRAFSKAVGCDYNTARANLAAFGRKPNHGVRWWDFVKWYQGKSCNGRTLREMDLAKTEDGWKHPARQQCTQYKTVGQFVAAHPRGRYVMRVSRHVIPLVDGQVYDWKEGKARRLLGVTEAIDCETPEKTERPPMPTAPYRRPHQLTMMQLFQ